MGSDGKKDQFRLGFLTAIEVPDKGFVGGLLVTNHVGRPLEFQCTMPVKANTTQEILYGPTLTPFLLGELIGGTLIDKAGIKPDLILTDCVQVLELRNHIASPVAFVSPEQASANSLAVKAPAVNASLDQDPAVELRAADVAGMNRVAAQAQNGEKVAVLSLDGGMRLGRQIIRFHPAHGADSNMVARQSHQIPADANLCEPFDRVREALQETLRCGALR